MEIEQAVYPFLGPGRTNADVEQACTAIEQAYKAKGFTTVQVQIPPQKVRRGIVLLQIFETTVARLRVTGSRYFLPSAIKADAPSLAEGHVVNFNDVTRDIVALNQLPDRKITPNLRAGLAPGTVDIELAVADKLPLHGSVELNNRYSADTSELRLNASLSYNNLWQLGHSVGLSYQLSPAHLGDAEDVSGYYLARLPGIDWLTLMVQGTKQNSNVSTLGSIAVAGRGEVIGARAIMTLPPGKNFYESLTLGFDYKNFDQSVDLSTGRILTPITYFPISAAYTASWVKPAPEKQGERVIGSQTELNASVNFHLRGLGSSSAEFENNRFKSDGNFIYLRGDLSHTRDLPGGLEGFIKVQGQVANQPLINFEQFGGGGLGTARGYLEAEALGDNAFFGSIELRSPSLFQWFGRKADEWRIYAFFDGGFLDLHDPLPDQEQRFELASFGAGSRMRVWDHFNGSVDLGVPLTSQTKTQAWNPLVTFRLWADF